MEAHHPFNLFAFLVSRYPFELVRDVDAFDDEHTIFCFDVANRVRNQIAAACVDLARLQRASQGAGQSTGRGRHDPINRGGIRRKVVHRDAIVLSDIGVDAKGVMLVFGRQPNMANRSPHPLDPNVRLIFDIAHLAPFVSTLCRDVGRSDGETVRV